MYKLNITNEDLVSINIEDIDKYIEYIEELTGIIWKIIPDYEDYIISEHGDIISIKSKRVLEKILNRYNYYIINLYRDTISQTFKIHRLVYITFINDKDIENYAIHHKDQNKINNHYTNLEKMSSSAHSKYHHDLESEEDLEKYEKIYNDKIKNDLTNKDLSKKYNISENIIRQGIKRYKVFLYSDKNRDIYNNLLKEEKDKLSKDISIENKKDRAIRYLKECKKIYNLYRYGNKSIKEISKLYNIPESTVKFQIKNQRIYLHINENLDKYISLSNEEKDNIYTNIILINDQKEYLKKAEEIYNRKQKENLTNQQLSKIFNIPEYSIDKRLKNQKIYLNINRNFDKFDHLTTKEKDSLYTNILTNNQNTRNKEYLIECKQIYDDKIKNNLSNKKLAKKYNMSKSAIDKRIRDYYIYYDYLNEDFDKFNSFTYKERDELYDKIYNDNLIEEQDKYLAECEKIYRDKIKNNLTNKQLAEKYNTTKSAIQDRIRDHYIYNYLNKNFNQFNSFTSREKDKLYKKIYKNDLIKEQDKYLIECEKFYNAKVINNLSVKDIINKYHVSKTKINKGIRDYKIFLFLDKNKDKFNNLSRKKRDDLHNKLLVENNDKEIMKLGKEIEKLKLAGLSIAKIMKKLNITKGKLRYTYKKYSKFIKNKELYKID